MNANQLYALLPLMLLMAICFMILPYFTGMAAANVQNSVFQNATGCYIDQPAGTSDVLTNCGTYQMAQVSGMLIGMSPYIVAIGICIALIVGAFVYKHKK